ncbi:MAG: S8 family serine peptidase, partial [bacterium]|nr:S8 family serine peptidase [bacterium]
MRLLSLALLGTSLLSLSFGLAETKVTSQAPSWVEIEGKQEFTGRLIVRPVQRLQHMAAGKTLEEAMALGVTARTHLARFERLRHIPQTDETLVIVPKGLSEQVLSDALMATGLFQYATPDWLVFPCAPQQSISPSTIRSVNSLDPVAASRRPVCPDDPLFSGQWHHEPHIMNSCLGWGVNTGDPAITVAVCDTGIRTTHEDLLLHRKEGYNAYDRLWESQGGQVGPSPHSHGTLTTGAAAANGNNGVGVSGVGWNLSHRMMRVSNLASGSAPLSVLQHAARVAIENGDRVANVSYTGVQSPSNLTTATYMRSHGGILVWAADNSSTDHSFANRNDDDLIVVGASDSSDGLAWFSSFGSYVDLVAPGVGISTPSAGSDQSYSTPNGTSLSAPLASGHLAMIWSERPTLSP